MNKNNWKYFFLVIFSSFYCRFAIAQVKDSSRIFFTTSAGFIVPVAKFAKAYKNSFALNSGVEYKFKKHYFAQLVLDFNGVKYNQQVKDNNSSYLFQQTNSSVLLLGVNIIRSFNIMPSGRFALSPYVGLGYANIGEPRLTVNNNTGIVQQTITRMAGLFSRQGLRILYQSKSKMLQTIYIDASYWKANINIQQSKPQALSIVIGTRTSL
jgi:hypothetical protein